MKTSPASPRAAICAWCAIAIAGCSSQTSQDAARIEAVIPPRCDSPESLDVAWFQAADGLSFPPDSCDDLRQWLCRGERWLERSGSGYSGDACQRSEMAFGGDDYEYDCSLVIDRAARVDAASTTPAYCRASFLAKLIESFDWYDRTPASQRTATGDYRNTPGSSRSTPPREYDQPSAPAAPAPAPATSLDTASDTRNPGALIMALFLVIVAATVGRRLSLSLHRAPYVVLGASLLVLLLAFLPWIHPELQGSIDFATRVSGGLNFVYELRWISPIIPIGVGIALLNRAPVDGWMTLAKVMAPLAFIPSLGLVALISLQPGSGSFAWRVLQPSFWLYLLSAGFMVGCLFWIRPGAIELSRFGRRLDTRRHQSDRTAEDAATRLRKLVELRDDGLITESEYEEKRAQVVSRL